jgi:hypothetical protein
MGRSHLHKKFDFEKTFTPGVTAFKLRAMNDLERYADELEDDGQYLPPECLIDKYHPRNDVYFSELNITKKRLASQKALMKPKAAAAVYLYISGKNNREIGEALNLGPKTIGNYIKSPDGLRLRSLIDHHQQQIDGPNADHRKGILYRITIDNEKKDPNTAIAAVKEINKMSGSYEQGGSGSHGNVFNIQINNDLMPKGALDVMPETFETRQAALEHDD